MRRDHSYAKNLEGNLHRARSRYRGLLWKAKLKRRPSFVVVFVTVVKSLLHNTHNTQRRHASVKAADCGRL